MHVKQQKNLHEPCGRPWVEHKIFGVREQGDRPLRNPRWVCPDPLPTGGGS